MVARNWLLPRVQAVKPRTEGTTMEDLETTEGQEPVVETPERTSSRKAPAKAKGKKETKKETKKAGEWKKDPKLLAKLKKDIPLGSLVRYVGSRVSAFEGKSGVVTGWRDAN